MILQHRTIPLRLLKLIALEGRLPIGHPKIAMIKEDIARRRAGYQGEQALDYYLDFLHDKDYFILQDLRLQQGDKFFQIDNLIMTPRFLLIIEVKNIAGTIYFDPLFNQLIRTHNGKEEVFQDPMIQAQHQQQHLQSWIKDHKIDDIPIDYLIAISNRSTYIKTHPNFRQATQKVAHIENVMSKIKETEKRYQQIVCDDKILKKLSRQLIKSHVEPSMDICEEYEINKDELISGVLCSQCHSFSMTKKKYWHCHICQSISHNAHIQAIYDYLLLIKPTISNTECRQFLGLSSQVSARRLLQSMKLPSTGTTKDRVYYLPPLKEFDKNSHITKSL